MNVEKYNAKECLERLSIIEEAVENYDWKNLNKKYESKVIIMNIRKYLELQVAKKPIDISEDGMSFRCPTCGILMESEGGTWEAYDFCDICGQRFKDEDTMLEKILNNEEEE